jgi:hypothetical protein
MERLSSPDEPAVAPYGFVGGFQGSNMVLDTEYQQSPASSYDESLLSPSLMENPQYNSQYKLPTNSGAVPTVYHFQQALVPRPVTAIPQHHLPRNPVTHDHDQPALSCNYHQAMTYGTQEVDSSYSSPQVHPLASISSMSGVDGTRYHLPQQAIIQSTTYTVPRYDASHQPVYGTQKGSTTPSDAFYMNLQSGATQWKDTSLANSPPQLSQYGYSPSTVTPPTPLM